jgi:hypothetical protein
MTPSFPSLDAMCGRIRPGRLKSGFLPQKERKLGRSLPSTNMSGYGVWVLGRDTVTAIGKTCKASFLFRRSPDRHSLGSLFNHNAIGMAYALRPHGSRLPRRVDQGFVQQKEV